MEDMIGPFKRNPVIEAYKKDVDFTLLRENLALTHEQRVRRLIALQKMALALKEAGKKARGEL